MEILPWVTNGEFYQFLLLLRWGLTFLYCKWKWSILTFFYSTDQERKNLYHGGLPPWHGKKFLYIGGRIGIGSGIFHLVVPPVHFHLQYMNGKNSCFFHFLRSSWNIYITDHSISKTSVKKDRKKLIILMEIENTQYVITILCASFWLGFVTDVSVFWNCWFSKWYYWFWITVADYLDI